MLPKLIDKFKGDIVSIQANRLTDAAQISSLHTALAKSVETQRDLQAQVAAFEAAGASLQAERAAVNALSLNVHALETRAAEQPVGASANP